MHGLHVEEALHALQERLDLLQSIVQDLTAQQQAHMTVQAASSTDGSTFEAGQRGSSTRQVLMQLLLSDDQPLHVRQAAGRQQLRVIVGRGNNSSGGEASLPRAVERWLADLQYKYGVTSGAIDVKLKKAMPGY